MPWTPSADAIAIAALIRQYLADQGITAADVLTPKAAFDAFATKFGGGAHTDGSAVSWTQGSGAGQISFGAAAPNGSIVSASGCDEGGFLSFANGNISSSGVVFTVHFATAFLHAPAVVLFAQDENAAHLLFIAEMHVTSTTGSFSFNTKTGVAPLSNATYSFFWIAKGSK